MYASTDALTDGHPINIILPTYLLTKEAQKFVHGDPNSHKSDYLGLPNIFHPLSFNKII